MGKTTTVRAIMGLMPPAIRRRRASTGADRGPARLPHRAGRASAWCPEGRQIFPNLTVRENLVATARPPVGGGERTVDARARLRPVSAPCASARDNIGNQLSGGEQQMLAIGRALMTNPRLLILDEATEGLAPLIRAEIWRCLATLKARGPGDPRHRQEHRRAARLADRHYIIEKGRVVWTGTSAELRADEELQHRYLGV